MKVHFRQAGGFAGLNLASDLDTETMPRHEAKKLTQLLQDSKLPAGRKQGSQKARDLATYEITVEDESGTVTTSFDDMSVPPRADKLLDFLRARARPRPLE